MAAHSLEILFEDNHLLVINKPNLMPTMGAEPGQQSLLDHAKIYIKQKYNKPGNVYLGVVSRLDAFVSGVIVFARTSKSAARLTRQFADRDVKKTYIAIVEQPLPTPAGQLVDWIFKDDLNKRMRIGDNSHRNAKKAELSYREIGQHKAERLLEIQPLTGRKHQIRVQLSGQGSPIVGDRKYSAKSRRSEGICLHSQRLCIQHPTNHQNLQFECNPPKWWNLHRFSLDDTF